MTEPDFQTCAVCGRGILKGERTYGYATPAGDLREVCALCRPSAERAGWVAARRLSASPAPSKPQARKAGKLGELGSALRRRAKPLGSRRPDEEEGRPEPEPAHEPSTEPVVVEPAPQPVPALHPAAEALRNFNAGSTPRMIAGLCRSLGPATAEVVQTAAGDGAVITVAWELSWYSWEARGTEVREIDKGGEISERAEGVPSWNARVEDDGRVSLLEG